MNNAFEPMEIDNSAEDGEDGPVDFEYCVVSRKQLEELLQRCVKCDRRPKNIGKQRRESGETVPKRTISFTAKGSCITAGWYCPCNKSGKKKLHFSMQPFIEGTRTREGNLAIVAAMITTPIDYSSMLYFCKALRMPMFTEQSFHQLNRHYVNPVVMEHYAVMKQEVFTHVTMPLEIAMDGQYDSVGYSAELECETAMDVKTGLVLTFTISHKSEVEGISNRMEKLGAQKVIDELVENYEIDSATTDKHAGVIKMLGEKGIQTRFDLWHLLRLLGGSIRKTGKRLSDEDRKTLRMLARRLFSHIWHVIDLVAEDHPAHFVELVYAFFSHVIGFHRWNVNVKLLDLVPAEPSTKFSRIAEIKRLKFEIVTTCPHDELDNFATPPVPVNSPPLQLLLELLGKNAFISDIRKVYSKCATSALESFHSIRIRYCPKRKFFALRGLTVKTMLATMHWNTTRLAERKAVTMYESFSKARGRNRLVTRKEVAEQGWKRKIVEKAVDRKLQYGPGAPDEDDVEQEEEEYDFNEDELVGQLQALMLTDNEEEVDEEEVEEMDR